MARRIALPVILALHSGCLFGPASDPGYPFEYVASFPTDSLGEPAACTFAPSGAAWACVCEGGLLVNWGGDQAEAIPMPDLVPDAAFSSYGSACAFLTAGELFVAAPGQAVTTVTLDGPGAAVEPSPAGGFLVVHGDGSISSFSAAGTPLEVITTDMQAPLAAVVDLSLGQLVMCDSTVAARFDLSDGTRLADFDLPSPPVDLFAAGSGRTGAALEGGNELWVFSNSGMGVDILVTFPDVPACGACTPDSAFYYAGCPGAGLVVAASSGEQVRSTAGFGTPSDIAISGDGTLAAVASPQNGTVTILGY